MNDLEFFNKKIELINEGFNLTQNVTWDNYVERQYQVILWKIKVIKFLNQGN